MDVSVSRLVERDGEMWKVEAYGIRVSFDTEAAATEFAEKLKRRIEAPHDLPMLKGWADEQAAAAVNQESNQH